MSDQFYKTMKKKEKEQVFEKRMKESVHLMGQLVNGTNQDEFFSKFVDDITRSVQEQKDTQIEKKSQKLKSPILNYNTSTCDSTNEQFWSPKASKVKKVRIKTSHTEKTEPDVEKGSFSIEKAQKSLMINRDEVQW